MGTIIPAPDSTPARHHAAHAGRITLTHADTAPDERLGGHNGATTWWADGTTSYVVHFRSGHVHGWTMADECDTAVQAVDSLRAGENMSGERLWAALRDVRRLRNRLEALEGELILYAREGASENRARLSLREIGEVTGTSHPAVIQRLDRMHKGSHADFRQWLVQGTDRETLHGGGSAPVTKVPTLREQIDTAPGGAFLAEAIPTDPTGYVLTVLDYGTDQDPNPQELLRLDLGDWDHFRAASAGHRLIERGYSVLPAAHFEGDRVAGWRPGPDGLTYSAPVYRIPRDDETEEPPGAYCGCSDPNCPTPDGQYTHGS